MSIEPTPSSGRQQRDRGAAEPARFALLGLLLEKPAHGYDLSRHFVPSSALGDVIHLGESHLYALLARLERDGLIVGEAQDSGSYPQRRVFRLTAAGRDAVDRWIDEPVSHPRDMRLDFPLKLFIARTFGAERAAELIERQRSVFRAYIARLESEEKPAGSGAEGKPAGSGGEEKPADSIDDAAFLNLMRLGRIGRAQAALDWLDRCAELR